MKRINLDRFSSLADENLNILFVFGAARSGTTYLGRIVDKYFDYGMGPEGSIISTFGPRINAYGNLMLKENMTRLLSDLHRCEMLTIMRDRWRQAIRTDVSLDMLWEELPEYSFAGAVYAVFASVARAQGKPRIGNKDPAYLRHLDLIHKLFPLQARYLDIVRDGRDVAMSNLQMEWGQSNVMACARNWRGAVATSENFAKKVGPDRYLQIKYEELLDDPTETLSKIEKLLEVELSVSRKAQFIAEHEANNLKGNHGKWRQEMSMEDQRIFEAVAGDALVRHGYDTVFENPTVSFREIVWNESAEFCRKVKLNLKHN